MTTTGSTPQALDTSWPRDQVSVRTVAQQLVLTSYERSALTLEQYAEKVVAFAESGPERARRAAIRKRIDILRDAWGPLLRAAIENWMVPAVVDAVLGPNRDHLDLSRNPAKNIWSQLAVTYKLPPVRSTPKLKSDGERYIELLKDGDPDVDLWWQMVEVLLQACNEVLIWPDVIDRNGRKVIKHRLACGDTAVIVTTEEDPTEIECVLIVDEYTDLNGTRHAKYRLWSERWHAEFERDGKGDLQRTGYVDPRLQPERQDTPPEEDDSAANPYPEWHMTLLRLWPWPDAIWDSTTGEDLVDLTVHGGTERALYRYQQKMGGFKQGVVTGEAIEQTPQQMLDPGALLKAEGQGINFQIVDWQTDMVARQSCMMTDELAASASRGINPERYKRTASYQNATAAQIADSGLAEWRARSSLILGRAERRYKRAFCIVAKAHQIENPPDPDVELEVQHAPMAYPSDPAQQVAVEQAEIALALESQVTMLQRRHPEWTEAECRAELQKRLDDVAWVAEQKAKRNTPTDPTNESASAEQNGARGPVIRDSQKPPAQPGTPPAKGEEQNA